MVSHEKALDWQELFELAVQQELSPEDLKGLAYRVAGTCKIPLCPTTLTSIPQRILLPRNEHQKPHSFCSTMLKMCGRLPSLLWKGAISQRPAALYVLQHNLRWQNVDPLIDRSASPTGAIGRHRSSRSARVPCSHCGRT